MTQKLGVIVPYRNRFEQLQEFKREIKKYLKRKNIPFEIFIVEQDNAKLFNRGALLNIGYTYAKKAGCDYVVFHDVDMLPFRVDYSYSDTPIHLATRFKNANKLIFDEYFGGVTLFPSNIFESIDGFSNKYWGWGYEDSDLLYRCIKKNVELDTFKIKNQFSSLQKLKFNGNNAYVRGLNKFNFKKPITFFISFKPNEVICDVEKYTDDYNIFTIPGYDFSISFNSYSRYNISLFNKNLDCLYVNSNITKDYYTNIAITIDEQNQEIRVYQDAELLDTIKDFGEIYDYSNQEYFYIGMGNPLSDTSKKYFGGVFDKFIVLDNILTLEEIKSISIGDYEKIKNHAILCYDTNNIVNYKLFDLSNNHNDGEIFNCEIIEQKEDAYKEIKIPFRRDSIFISLPHEENGFVNNAWKDQSIRWNQLRFYNEVHKNDELIYNDGLSTLEFIQHGMLIDEENVKQITIGL
jgi:hypothetical protein